MSDEFKVGDVVELKSGSPPMTVEEVDGSQVDLLWFHPDETLRNTRVSAGCLKKWDGPVNSFYHRR